MGIVIVGAGECGVRAAFALRTAGFAGDVTLIGSEPELPYERPPLSKNTDVTLQAIRPKEAFETARIKLCRGEAVQGIDRVNKRVVVDGRALPFQMLLLATGSRARKSETLAGTLSLRTFVDAQTIMMHVKPGAKIGIIGAGFIGLELAAMARKVGAEVSVYHNGQAVLARSVPPQVADIIAARHRAEGVHLYLGATVQSADATSITLADGLTRTFDCVIGGIGAVPNVELAQEAGLSVENGIQVDEFFCTSAPDIYAAGDCCNFPWRGTRLRLESWRAAQDHADHVAAAILGARVAYDKVPWFWSDQYDQSLQVAGLFESSRPTHERDLGPGAKIVFQCDDTGALAAAAGVGNGQTVARDLRILEKIIEKRAGVVPADISNINFNLKTLLRAG
jgi:3-phenylpropionate/trans-cinnamate dioxygenase ferredoxin reductase component